MEYLDIIEENFTKSDYVAYLRGSILMWLLEDKPLDIPQFKLYADKLVEVMEEPQSTEKQKPTAKIEMMQTPAGYVKVGDVIGYDRSNKRIRFGTISRLNKDGVIWLTHSYCVVFGDDGKQEIYQSMDGSIEHYRVCKVL